MHITNKKLGVDIFTVGNLQNIPVQHKTGFVVQGHILHCLNLVMYLV